MFGKQVRMERVIDRNSGNAVIIPVDHGMSMGPIDGLTDMRNAIDSISRGGATAVVMHKGIVPYGHRSSGHDIGLILHLSASTNMGTTSDCKVLVATVEEGLKLGADAVSVHLNIGSETEPSMLHDIGEVSRKCMEWGMPLLAMAYPRGPGIKNPFDVDLVKHSARVAAELGADVIKTNYTGDPDTFREVVKGALAPVVIAGGPKVSSDEDLLRMVKESLEAGGRGVSIGRNVFQHRNVEGITKAISSIVLHGSSVEEAVRELG